MRSKKSTKKKKLMVGKTGHRTNRLRQIFDPQNKQNRIVSLMMLVICVIALTVASVNLMRVLPLNVGEVQAASSGDFQSAATGNWNAPATWQRYNGTSWVTSVTNYPSSTSAGVITVRNTHIVSVATAATVDQVVVQSGGKIVVSATEIFTIANEAGTDLQIDSGGTVQTVGTLTINADANLNIDGIFQNGIGGTAGAVTMNGTCVVSGMGVYEHRLNAGTVPTCSWSTGSTADFIGPSSSTADPAGLGQSFYNVIWEYTGTGVKDISALKTVNGTFTIRSMSTSPLVLGSIVVGTYNFTNLDVETTAGTIQLTTTVAQTFNIAGNFIMGGSGGTLSMSAGAGTATLNITGNFSHTAGTITESSTGAGAIVFNKSGTQTYTAGGTITNTINFTVNSGSTLQMAADATVVGGGGSFTLASGAGLGITSSAGITASGATGNIQVTGTRAYASGADYIYNGVAAGSTGNGLPATINSLTVNNSNGVTLSGNTAVTANLTISSGSLDVSASNFPLTVGGNYSNSGTFNARAGTFTLNGSAQQTLSGTMTGSSAFAILLITNSSGSSPDTSPSVIFSSSVTAGTFTVTTGNVKLRFQANSSSTFATINWNGQASSSRVALRSSAAGTPWYLTVSGTSTVSSVDTKDSNACGGNTIMATNGTNLDTGNNSCWVFSLVTNPDATSVTYTTGGDGGISGDVITITGTNFGTVSGGSRATCAGALGTGCVKFIAGGAATIADSNITTWTNTSISFTIATAIGSNGGVSALQVVSASSSDQTPLTFYIYPNVTAVSSLGSNAAREYNAADTDGLIMLSGDHFGVAGTVIILGQSATGHATAEGNCLVGGYVATTACYEVPASITDALYTGNIVLTRVADGKTFTWTSFGILPRISVNTPALGVSETTIQITGNHFCETGTCPVSPNRSSASDNVKFGATQALDNDFVTPTSGSITVTSSVLTTLGNNRLLLAIISIRNTSSQTVSSMSDTGLGLTWALVASSTNSTNARVEVWRALATNVFSGTVTASLSGSAKATIVVSAFSGVHPGGTNGSAAIGAVGTAFGNSVSPSLTISTGASNSLVVSALAAQGTPTVAAGSNQTLTVTQNTSGGADATRVTGAGNRQNSATPSPGSVTSDYALGSAQNWSMIAIEIKK